MDHLIQDHEKRQRYWRSGRIPEIDIINNNGNSNSASSQLIHKLLAITISITAAWITRIAWLQKASIVIKALGIDKLMNRIDNTKVMTALKSKIGSIVNIMNRIDNTKVMTALKSRIGSIVNIIIRKKVVTPPQVVAPKSTNFIPKILITIVMGIGLGVGIHHNQEYLKTEVMQLRDHLHSLKLNDKIASLQLSDRFDHGITIMNKFAKQTNKQIVKGLKSAHVNIRKGLKHANKGISDGIEKTVIGIEKTVDTSKKITLSSISTLSEVSSSVSSTVSTSFHEIVNEGKVIISNIDAKSKQVLKKLTTKKPVAPKSKLFSELTRDGDSSIRATFVNAKGNTLASRLWEKQAGPNTMRPFVVFLHGIGAHVNRVPRNESGVVLGDEYVANYFLEKGFNFYSYDQEGHGFSQGERIYVQDWKSYIADAEQFLELVKRRSPKGTPYFLMGESFGGALSIVLGQKLWGINDQNINVFKDFKGVLLIGPAIHVEMPSPVIVFILRYLLAPIIPKSSPFFMPQPLSRDKIWEDKSVGDWCTEEDLLGNGRNKLKLQTALQVVLLLEHVQNMIKSRKVSFPWAIVQADNDQVTPMDGAMLLQNYSVPYVEVIKNDKIKKIKKDKIKQDVNKMLTIRAGYHDLLTGKQSDSILNFLSSWANERLVTFYEKLNKFKE